MNHADGHPYYSGYPAGKCGFNADLTAPVWSTDPTHPAVTSTDFPPSGSSQPGKDAGQSGTFTFASSDPVPCTGCKASGVYEFEYSLNSPLPSNYITTSCKDGDLVGRVMASNPGGTATATSCTVPVGDWGTNTLYVAAIDKAGNVSQTYQYTFYAPWNPSTPVQPGDINGDQIPDLLGTTSSNLVLYPGNKDLALTPVVAGHQANSPDGTAWNTYQITHRGTFSGSFTSQNVDDLFAHKDAYLYIYLNNPGSLGKAPEFDDTGNINLISRPSCQPTLDNSNNCTDYSSGSWSDVSQILAPGDAWTGSSADSGLPSLLTIENDHLWLYQGEFGDALGSPVLLGSSGWDNMTLIAPGKPDVPDGQLTIWARDNATGTLYSYPVTIDANGLPTLDPSSPGTPVTATSGTVIGGVSLPSSTYPAVASPGRLDNSSYPGLYAETTTGSAPHGGGSCASGCLWYYPGQPTTGGAPPLASTPVFVGILSTPVSQLS